jgi:hypothetical protein
LVGKVRAVSGQIAVAVVSADHAAHGVQGFLGDAGGVGTHVGDEADRSVPEVDAFVELLGQDHRLLA